MTRIPKLKLADLSNEQKRVHDDIVSGPRGRVGGPLLVWLNRPELAQRAQALGRYCRYDSSLAPRLSELAILVTARIWDAGYEWEAHEQPAKLAGLSEAVITALQNDHEPQFALKDESIVYRFARELNLNRKVSPALYREAEEELGRDALIDLVGVLGYYSLISMTINAFEIDS